MRKAVAVAITALIAAGIATTEGSAQSASSSNPFAGIKRLTAGKNKPVTDQDGKVLGPPVQFDVDIINIDEKDGKKLKKSVQQASLIAGALTEDRDLGQDILAAARGDYARILGVMYNEGYFSSIINITLDGVEAAEIAPLDAPAYINDVVISVDPGPRFKFSRADLGPLASDTAAIEGYAIGESAGTGIIKRATSQAIRDWRDASHAKARVTDQEVIADHDAAALESRIDLDPGPSVTLGHLQATGNERLNTRRLLKIAGFPAGETYDPEKLEDVRKRLRRSGIFSAITLVEAETLNPDNSMDVGLTVVEQKLRRIGTAFEISTIDGAKVSAYWLHRNLFGGGERFRVEAEASDVDARDDKPDYSFNISLDRPATINADTTGYIGLKLSKEDEPEYYKESADLSIGFHYIRSERLTADTAITFSKSKVNYGSSYFSYESVSLPTSVTWDRRDDMENAKKGFWLSGGVTPFVGIKDTGSGVSLTGEGRIYHSMLEKNRLTFAARAGAGTVIGPNIVDVPPDYLFFSGGSGSVRGQPYESLGFDIPLENTQDEAYVGGKSIINLNFEIRYQIRDKIGAVAFVDAGQIWDDEVWQGETKSQAGAGIGVRYDTPIGPLRLDVAAPIKPRDDVSKLQLYLGLGQAF